MKSFFDILSGEKVLKSSLDGSWVSPSAAVLICDENVESADGVSPPVSSASFAISSSSASFSVETSDATELTKDATELTTAESDYRQLLEILLLEKLAVVRRGTRMVFDVCSISLSSAVN